MGAIRMIMRMLYSKVFSMIQKVFTVIYQIGLYVQVKCVLL